NELLHIFKFADGHCWAMCGPSLLTSCPIINPEALPLKQLAAQAIIKKSNPIKKISKDGSIVCHEKQMCLSQDIVEYLLEYGKCYSTKDLAFYLHGRFVEIKATGVENFSRRLIYTLPIERGMNLIKHMKTMYLDKEKDQKNDLPNFFKSFLN